MSEHPQDGQVNERGEPGDLEGMSTEVGLRVVALEPIAFGDVKYYACTPWLACRLALCLCVR